MVKTVQRKIKETFKVVFCRVRVRSVGYEICYKTYRVRSVGYESRTEVTEFFGLGIVLYRTLPASPGFGIKGIPPYPGTGTKLLQKLQNSRVRL